MKITRAILKCSVGIAICMGTAPAWAQDAPANEADAEDDAIIVTGSRVQRDGYEAPTPLTVLDSTSIEKAAPANIADFVNQLPQLSATASSRVGNGATSTGTAGLALLNLRGLGSNRTLVLIDNQRVAPSTQAAEVDINNIPSALIQRVDVVTGGASAAYGSDAVAGVVNFIIDRKFTGLKAKADYSVTSRGDNKSFQLGGAFGMKFADDKAHLVVSVEHEHEDGIDSIDPTKRKWYTKKYLVPNPAYRVGNGEPRQIIADNVNYINVSQGSVINSVNVGGAFTNGVAVGGSRRNFYTAATGLVPATPLFGTMFGQGGAVQQFVYGTPLGYPASPASGSLLAAAQVNANFMIGGNDWNEGTVISMIPRINRTNGWASLSYELTPSVTARIEASYGKTHTTGSAAYQRNVNNIDVSATNPFLPQSVRDAAAAANVTSFRVGYSSFDLGRMVNDIERSNLRIVGTLEGEFGNGWEWQAYYQYGQTKLDINLRNSTDNVKFSNAIDAVLSNGQIVCRTTIANPTNGCVPLNIFGIGVASPAAIAYVKGTAFQKQTLTEKVLAYSINGDPFSTWAGPVSFAAGIEHRSESAVAVGDPVSANFIANPALYPSYAASTTGWFTGNFKSNAGSYKVTEGFGEVVVPLAKDSAIGKSLELNGAARYTDYSLSGSVLTWKAGLTYEPIEDIRVRVVKSRDIRAPNIAELFAAGSSQAQDVIVGSGQTIYTAGTIRITTLTDGNRALTPEKADTLGLGVVFKPRFLPGFSASIDYYNIRINDYIATLAINDIVSRCVAGETVLCGFINGVTNTTTNRIDIQTIRRVPVNVASLKARGIDFDASYRKPIGNGTLAVRFLASKALNYALTNAGVTNEAVGENGGPFATANIPRLRTFTTLGYDTERFGLQLTMRTISSGVYDVAPVTPFELGTNVIDGARYLDLAGNVTLFGKGKNKTELFFKIDNLLDKDPPVAAGSASSTPPYNPVLYDGIGRSFRVGIRTRL